MKPEMHKGPKAFERFRDAMKTILSVPKPTAKRTKTTTPKRKKPAAPKG